MPPFEPAYEVMKLIDKHLLREYLVPLCFCLIGFSMLYVVSGLFNDAGDFFKAGVRPGALLRFYGYYILAYADRSNIAFPVMVMPVCLLVAALYSLTRLTRQNELTAMRASGISSLRLMCPFVAVAVAFGCLAAIIQEVAAPYATRRVDDFRREEVGKAPNMVRVIESFKYRNPAACRTWRIARMDLDNPRELTGVQVTVERSARGGISRLVRITADKAEWRDGRWFFQNVREQRFDKDDQPDGPASVLAEGSLEMAALTELPEDFVFVADRTNLEKYASSVTILRCLERYGGGTGPDVVRAKVDAHLRLAMPWVCVVAVLLGIPAGARGGRQGVLAGVVLALALFLAFYAGIYACAFLGKTGVLAPWFSAWVSNVVFFVVGAVLVLRMS